MPCQICLYQEGNIVEAKRSFEGQETDTYNCPNGHEYMISWASEPIPHEPFWPPNEQHMSVAEAVTEILKENSDPNFIMAELAKKKLL